MVKNVYRNTKMKKYLILTSILHNINDDLASLCRKKTYCVHKYNSENLRVPCDLNQMLAKMFVSGLAF